MKQNIKDVAILINDEQLLRQMAEECSELTESALNAITVNTNDFFNIERAFDILSEEIADVECCIEVFLFKNSKMLETISGDKKQSFDNDILIKIAKESSRLSKWSLKLIRINEGTTPVKIEDARPILFEVMSNVVSYIDFLKNKYPDMIIEINQIKERKMCRWKDRLENAFRINCSRQTASNIAGNMCYSKHGVND